MSRHNSSSSHSNPSEHSFPFHNDEDDTLTHPTLLPNGILNDDDDEDEDDIVPAWPRKSSGGSASRDTQQQASQVAILRCRQLPTDLTAREFAGLFTFADGYVGSSLKEEQGERMGTASFNSSSNAAKARSKMASVAAFNQVVFDITTARSSSSSNGTKSLGNSNGVDVPTPPATLSTSSKSTGSSGSMQHSRLSSYVKDKPDLTSMNAIPTLTPSTSLGMDEFYGSVPKGSVGVISSSVPTNFSTSAGGTVWSPTSPRFASVGGELAKSPPTGFSMLPPPTAKEDDAWSRSTTATRFAGLNLSGNPADLARGSSDRNGGQGGMSPILSHGFPSIDKSLGSPHLNGNAPPFAGTYQHAGMGFSSASAKQNAGMMNNAYPAMNPAATGFVVGNRLGPALINTNPADQNPPCNTLYVGNLPLATTEEELKSLFSRQQGYRRLCYRTKSNGPMCFVEFEDVHYAIQALKLLQGVILSSSIKGGIRLSFSKNPLGVRKMDAAQGFVPQQQQQQQQQHHHHHHHHSHTLQQPQQHSQSGTLMSQHAHMGAPGHLVNNGYAPLAPPGLASSNGHTTNHANPQQPINMFGHGMQPTQHQAQPSHAPVWR